MILAAYCLHVVTRVLHGQRAVVCTAGLPPAERLAFLTFCTSLVRWQRIPMSKETWS